ncbi:hypothetical protein [Motilimonas sp. E26]|uniref:hypothetical protein n=1 Tax=Motilimonas sp. E26 TaxID=2865674 RepID=UPI001E5BC08C|nr:hypothetical protein [Motilimonas sp. E26]MCE0559387.1 hypothetical protein [Motilimonas sp. E26]
MSKYNCQYYIVDDNYSPETIYLSPTQATADRFFGFEEMSIDNGPLFFENAYRDEDKAANIRRPIKQAHMHAAFVIMHEDIKKDMEDYFYFHPGVELFPAVLIDDDGQFHEHYWFINRYGETDCLDYDKSIISNYKENNVRHSVKKYSLRDDVLDAIPEEKRLILKIAKTNIGYTIAHQRIVDIFNKHQVDTLRFHRLDEWQKGKQFKK